MSAAPGAGVRRRPARGGVARRAARLAAALLLLGAGPAGALERLPAVLHVHSDLSTGDLSLEALAERAAAQGIGALLLSENYLLRVEYGLPPFRALTRVAHEEPSVRAAGLERYLARVAEVRRRYPAVLIVPGVEVLPHYHWSGSPLGLALTLHNVQKNLLVFGLADAAALRALPVIGNGAGRRLTWQSALDALPALLLVPGVVLVARKRPRRRRLGRAWVVLRERAWLPGALLIAVGLLALVRGWPFAVERFPWWEEHGLAPHQAVIDEVDRRGGLTVWSFPEAPDYGTRWLGPLRVDWRTDPAPDDLLRSFRYTAFGAVYEQPTRVAEPGGTWDRLLVQYAAGERSRPAWAVGEAGFHGATAGKRLGSVQTVFLVEARSEAALLDAFRRGRLYALHRTPERALVLGEFAVVAAGVAAGPGETLRLPPGTPLEVRLAVTTSDGAAEPLRVTLVDTGTVAEVWAGPAPLRAVHRATFDGRPRVFRLEVRAPAPHRLLASPVFVRAR